MASLEDGAIIKLSYDMWLEDYDGLFDTTDRDRASASGIYNPQHTYGPIVAVVGAGRLVPGLEKAVKSAKVGETTEIDIPSDDAYGPRDPKRIETVPMQRLKQAKIQPKVGERIRYKDRPATITRVSGGRVWIDTNSPLAGRGVRYAFTVDEVIEDPIAKTQALLDMGYRPNVGFQVGSSADGEAVEVVVPDEAKYDQRFLVAKFRIAHDIGRYTPFSKVRFVEEFATSEDADTMPAPTETSATMDPGAATDAQANDANEATATNPSR